MSQQPGDAEQTAQVVLRPGGSLDAGDPRSGEVPPEQETADRAVAWFAAKGFACGPVVGISFSISGPAETFERVFGRRPGAGDLELPLDALDDDVLTGVDAVTATAPPDFGPGNP
jgi:hypothetical protein